MLAWFIVLLLSVFQVTSNAHNKIIYLISPPRSLSVAFTRMMQARGDFEVFHEPSQCLFNALVNPDRSTWTVWYRDEIWKSFDEVKEAILKEAQTKNVFVKEMGFALKEFIVNDNELLQDPDIFFVFLLRNPHSTTISYYKKLPVTLPNLNDIIGYKPCYDIYNTICASGVRKPLIIKTEELYSDPAKIIQKFCHYCEIPFIPESLHWDDLGDSFSGIKEWHESKLCHVTQEWHGDAIKSTGFHKPHTYAIDENGNPTFEEIAPEHREEYRQAYEYNKVYYDLLLAEQ